MLKAFLLQALSLCVTAAVAFSVALPAFAEELTTLPALVDNKARSRPAFARQRKSFVVSLVAVAEPPLPRPQKDNARVQLIYEVRPRGYGRVSRGQRYAISADRSSWLSPGAARGRLLRRCARGGCGAPFRVPLPRG